jgi:uncharacterized protein YkwD
VYPTQTFWTGYPIQFYQAAYSPGVYPAAYTPQYYQPAYSQPYDQTAYYAQTGQPTARENAVPDSSKTMEKSQAGEPTKTTEKSQAGESKSSESDPYGFTAWLNATRASYGLPAVNHDPNLSSWAAMNNNQQASYGIGHFVMGPARRQNSAMGAFPGIESMWMASPAHRAALLDPTIRWIGIAGLGAYWTFNAN